MTKEQIHFNTNLRQFVDAHPCKIGEGHTMFTIYANFIEVDSPMLHAKFRIAICFHCILSICNIYLFPVLVLKRDSPFDCSGSCSLLFITFFQDHRTLSSREEEFFRFFPYMGVVAILVVLPGPFCINVGPLPMEATHEIWL